PRHASIPALSRSIRIASPALARSRGWGGATGAVRLAYGAGDASERAALSAHVPTGDSTTA
ncbi:MAG: hypothetical protein ACO3ZY_12570, partial [Phycisphaerales bacterium]